MVVGSIPDPCFDSGTLVLEGIVKAEKPLSEILFKSFITQTHSRTWSKDTSSKLLWMYMGSMCIHAL